MKNVAHSSDFVYCILSGHRRLGKDYMTNMNGAVDLISL